MKNKKHVDISGGLEPLADGCATIIVKIVLAFLLIGLAVGGGIVYLFTH